MTEPPEPSVATPASELKNWRRANLTEAERIWVGMLRARLQERRGFSLGVFADALVASVLPGAVLSPGGTDRYDLTWEDIRVEVKCSTRRQWAIGPAWGREDGKRVRRLWADVYVLASQSSEDYREDWAFWIVPKTKLGPKRTTIRMKHLEAWQCRRLDLRDLEAAIREEHEQSRPGRP